MGLPVAVGAVTTPLCRSVSMVFDLLGKGFWIWCSRGGNGWASNTCSGWGRRRASVDGDSLSSSCDGCHGGEDKGDDFELHLDGWGFAWCLEGGLIEKIWRYWSCLLNERMLSIGQTSVMIKWDKERRERKTVQWWGDTYIRVKSPILQVNRPLIKVQRQSWRSTNGDEASGYLDPQPAKLEDSHNLYQASIRAPHGKYATSLSLTLQQFWRSEM